MATELTGSGKYLTGNPNEYVHVDSGSVYVYVINIVNEVIGRSIYLCEKKEGDDIPTLSAADSDVKSCYQFLIMAADKAVISTRDIDNDRERLRKDFLDSINMDAGETGFSGTLIKWYQDRIVNEEEIIKSRQDEQNKVRRSKIRLMSSLFKKKNLLEYESDTDSPVYNVMSVLCDYMGIEICSYQTLVNACGNDFTINDILRVTF